MNKKKCKENCYNGASAFRQVTFGIFLYVAYNDVLFSKKETRILININYLRQWHIIIKIYLLKFIFKWCL